jgi:hypothetical protein
MNEKLKITAQLLADRLERLSADSLWAHRASGVRGSLLRFIVAIDQGHEISNDLYRLNDLLEQGYNILEKAALEYYRNKLVGDG